MCNVYANNVFVMWVGVCGWVCVGVCVCVCVEVCGCILNRC